MFLRYWVVFPMILYEFATRRLGDLLQKVGKPLDLKKLEPLLLIDSPNQNIRRYPPILQPRVDAPGGMRSDTLTVIAYVQVIVIIRLFRRRFRVVRCVLVWHRIRRAFLCDQSKVG